MGSKQELVLVDTNIFVIDLRYKKDVHYKKNLAFLTAIAENGTGFTTIVNLLELCGILSFNLNEKQLYELWFYFQDRYKVTVQPAATIESNFPAIGINLSEFSFMNAFISISSRDSLIELKYIIPIFFGSITVE